MVLFTGPGTPSFTYEIVMEALALLIWIAPLGVVVLWAAIFFKNISQNKNQKNI